MAERELLKIELLHYLLDNSWARIPDGMECNLCLRNELILDLISIKQQCEELQVPVTTTWNLKFQCWASGTAQLVLIVFNGRNVHYITTATYQHKLRESNFTNTATCLTDSLEVDFKLSQIFVCIFSSLDNAVYKRKTTNYCLRVWTTSLKGHQEVVYRQDTLAIYTKHLSERAHFFKKRLAQAGLGHDCL